MTIPFSKAQTQPSFCSSPNLFSVMGQITSHSPTKMPQNWPAQITWRGQRPSPHFPQTEASVSRPTRASLPRPPPPHGEELVPAFKARVEGCVESAQPDRALPGAQSCLCPSPRNWNPTTAARSWNHVLPPPPPLPPPPRDQPPTRRAG